MNIFILDKDPEIAATYMFDIHVNKMIVESVQLLSNAYSKIEEMPKTQSGNTRKYSYKHHPCSIWVCQRYSNWIWLYQHTKALIKERKYRFNKGHFCEEVLFWISNNFPDMFEEDFSHKSITPFALAIPQNYKTNDPVQSYRNYYINDKQVDKNGKWMMKYTKREIPDWFPNSLKEKLSYHD